jgi:hypothetical protein
VRRRRGSVVARGANAACQAGSGSGTCRPRSRSAARRALAILEGRELRSPVERPSPTRPVIPILERLSKSSSTVCSSEKVRPTSHPADADSPSSARMKSGAPKARLVALAALTHREQKGCSASLAAVRFRSGREPSRGSGFASWRQRARPARAASRAATLGRRGCACRVSGCGGRSSALR